LDGTAGEVFAGQIPTRPSEILRVLIDKSLAPQRSLVYQDYVALLGWADEFRRLEIWTNADQANQAMRRLLSGRKDRLTRTEHMFFEGNRIDAVREMIWRKTTRGGSGRLPNCCPCKRKISKAFSGP